MKMKNVRGGYILISLDMIDISDDDSVIEIDFSRLTESKKSIRLCNINVGGEHKPDIDIKPDFGEDTIILSDVYGYDLIVSDDNSVLISEHRSAYELPIPEVSDAGKTIIVDSEGKYGLDDMPNELPIPESTDEGKKISVNSSGKYILVEGILVPIPSVTSVDKTLTIDSNLQLVYVSRARLFRHTIVIDGITIHTVETLRTPHGTDVSIGDILTSAIGTLVSADCFYDGDDGSVFRVFGGQLSLVTDDPSTTITSDTVVELYYS